MSKVLDQLADRIAKKGSKRSSPRFQKKPGKEGTLFRFAIVYRGKEHDPGAIDRTWRTWAYSQEHAEEKFYDSDPNDEEGWKIVSVSRMLEGSQHRATVHRR